MSNNLLTQSMKEHIVSYAKNTTPDLYQQRYVSGKLYDGQTFVRDLIDSYDNWLMDRLRLVLYEYPCKLNDGTGSYIRVSDISFDTPSIEETDALRGDSTNRVSRPLYPKEAREKDLTYAIRIRGSHNLYDVDGNLISVLANRVIGEVPCMLGSYYCHLRNKSDTEIMEMGECGYDPLGYFIVGGREFTLNIQCNLSYNLPILYTIQDKNKEMITILRTTALTPRGTFVNDTKITESRAMAIDTIVGGIKVGLNPFQVMRLLWDPAEPLSKDQMISLVLHLVTRDRHPKVRASILNTFSVFEQIEYDYADIVFKRNQAYSASKRSGINKDITMQDIIDDLDRFLFPHINPYSYTELARPEYKSYVRKMKVMYLAYNVAIYGQFLSGDIMVDDRNDWSTRQLSNVGIMFERLFLRIIKNLYSSFDGSSDSSKKSGFKEFETSYKHMDVLESFKTAFENNVWVVAANQRASPEDKNVVMEKERNIIAHYAAVTRINIPSSPRGGQVKVRSLHLSQLRFVCIWETPEGERAGLIMAKGASAVISKQTEDDIINDYLITSIEDNGYGISLFYRDEQPNRSSACLLNGKFVGFCDAEELRDTLLLFKRGGVVTKELGIVIKNNTLLLSTMGGRALCPTLVVGDGNPTFKQDRTVKGELVLYTLIKDGKVTQNTTYEELTSNGAIEYLDPLEQSQERVLLAQSIDDFRVHKQQLKAYADKPNRSAGDEFLYQQLLKKNYTYCEITPGSLIGIAASIIPIPNTNQAPRNVFQAAMGKQAQGIYHSNACNRFDREAKILTYPTRPIFSTEVSSRIGLDEMPSGETVTIAILADPNSQEDAITFKQSSIDRGLFNSVVYKTHRMVLKSSNGSVDILTNTPNIKHVQNKPHIYKNLQPNGLPKPGSYMDDGDCILGVRHHEGFKKGETEGSMRDVSIYLTRDEVGVVEKIHIHKSSDSTTTIAIKIRTVRVPIPGDKFADRHAQKGTMGAAIADEDMPFDRDGVSPDMIFNSHGLPSRMTIAKPIEMIVSKFGALTGTNFSADAFNNISVDTFARALHAYGFSRKGTKTLYNGATGRLISYEQLVQAENGELKSKLIPCQVFSGPCYYQRLRHEVIEKGHERGLEGKTDPVTQLPVGGRSGGAIRFGEMERDSLVAYGVAVAARERLIGLADQYSSIMCTNCSTEATYKKVTNELICMNCGHNHFGKCNIPYSIFILRRLLSGMNISLKFTLEKLNNPNLYK